MASERKTAAARPPPTVRADDTRDEKSDLLAGVTAGHLSGERVRFAEREFLEHAVASLAQTAVSLGADLADDWESSTIVFHNPCHPKHSTLLQLAAERARQHPNTPRPRLLPYHYLSLLSLYPDANPIPPLSALPTQNPYIIHPDRSLDYKPLTIWVSINIHKQPDEQPQEARDKVTKSLLLGGGIPVEKRAHADVLIVDQTTKFYQNTILGEMRKHGRNWRLAERDWVEGCERAKRVLPGWVGTLKVDDIKEEEESFGEMEMPVGKGPGRPTGKPRIEYTSQDDDFLCRYLAARHPEGSWQSRKTYALLAESENAYPIAARHSDQSWHERFKKTASAFSNRIKRYIAQGIDDSLKTEEERKKSAALLSGEQTETRSTVTQVTQQSMQRVAESNNTARREGARLTNIAAQNVEPVVVATIDVADNAQAGPSRSKADQISHKPNGRVVSAVQGTPPAEQAQTSMSEAPEASATQEAAVSTIAEAGADDEIRQSRRLVEESDDEEESTGAEQGVPALVPETLIEPATIFDNADLDNAAATAPAAKEPVGQVGDRDPRIPAASPTGGESVKALTGPTSAALQAPSTGAETQAEDSHSIDNQSETRGEETQAVLRDYAARQGLGPGASSGHGRKKSVHMDVDPIDHTRHRSHTPHTKPNIIASPPKPHRSPHIEQELRPASELIRTRQSLPVTVAYGQPQQAFSNGGYSVNIAVNVTPNDGISERRRDTQGRIERYETPSRTASSNLGMGEEGITSSGKRKRLEGRLSSSRRHHHRHSSPDTVYASTTLPPPLPRPRKSLTAHTPITPQREPSPPISYRQREAKVFAGEQLVMDVKEQYKRKIEGFSGKYGVGPRVIFGLVNDLPKVRGGVYWDDVERGLKEHFGY